MDLITPEIKQIRDTVNSWQDIDFHFLYSGGKRSSTWNGLDTTSIMIFVIDTINSIRTSVQFNLFSTLEYSTISSFSIQIANFDANCRPLIGIKYDGLTDKHHAALDALLCLKTLLINSGLYTLAKLRPQQSETTEDLKFPAGKTGIDEEFFI